MRAWKAKVEDLWKALEEKAQGLDVPKEKPTLVSMIGIQRMASFLDVKKCGEGMVDAIKVDGLPQIQILQRLLLGARASMHKMTRGRTSSVCSMKRRIGRKILRKGHVLCKKLFFGTIMCPS